jgi:hypothetical protein
MKTITNCSDQRDLFQIRSAGDISKEGECVSITASPDYCRRPKTRPDFDRGEDPDVLFLALDDRSNLIRLKLRDGDSRYLSIVKPATKGSCFFQPAMNAIPGDSLYPSYSRFV